MSTSLEELTDGLMSAWGQELAFEEASFSSDFLFVSILEATECLTGTADTP